MQTIHRALTKQPYSTISTVPTLASYYTYTLKIEGGRISVNWLKNNFNELHEDLEDRTNEVIDQYVRAYIMRKILKEGARKVATTSSGLQQMRETKLGICYIFHALPGDVSGHDTECGVDRWLSAPVVVMGLGWRVNTRP
ncbi:hypothetical protein J1N35_015492, partial [Gossypium stocksii]